MSYPLGHGVDEVERLQKQMMLLFPEELRSLVNPSDSFLDIGCGTGDVLTQLPNGVRYTGVDIKNIVRPIYLSLPAVKVIETDFLNWHTDEKFSFINFRLVLWSVSERLDFLKKGFLLLDNPKRFFIYEPDDQGLKFSKGLSALEDLGKEWRDYVFTLGKDPFVGNELPSLLNAAGFRDFNFKNQDLLRSGEDMNELKNAALNLLKIFSKYPGSDELCLVALSAIENLKKDDWLIERYSYAF